MCGRFTLSTDTQQVARHFQVLIPDALFGPRFNVAPSQAVPVVLRPPDQRDRQLQLMKWGLVPPWSSGGRPGPINARSETAATQPMFRHAFKHRRCLIPADGFFEWSAPPSPTAPEHACGSAPSLFDPAPAAPPKPRKPPPKPPHLLRLRGHRLFAFAGLYERKGDVTTVTVLTTNANDLLRPIHDRMPVILPPDAYDAWLDPDTTDVGPLQHLLRPYPADDMTDTLVSTRVNSPRADDPRCIESTTA